MLRRLLMLCWLLQLPAVSAAGAETVPGRIASARSQIGVTLTYNPAYVRLDYPGGDVPISGGVCSDVVIRALRSEGLDLQEQVHLDMRQHFDAYPRNWGLSRTDRNIDHRRVPNLETWMRRRGWSVSPIGKSAADFLPGDLVTWRLPGNLPHIGIVSDRLANDGLTPLILHNVGAGTHEEDVLFKWTPTGQFRPE